MTNNSEELSLLRNSEFFSDLSETDLAEIAARLTGRVFPPGATIVREGAPGDRMFIIKQGKVEIKKREASLGIDMTLASLGEGACFGEMALLAGGPRTASVVAVVTTEVFVLIHEDFVEILSTHPEISMALNRILARRIQDMNARGGIGVASLPRLNIDPEVVRLLPPQVMQRHKVIPVALLNNTLAVAMVNPTDLPAIDEVRRFAKGAPIEPLFVSERDFITFMETKYPDLIKRQSFQKTGVQEIPAETVESTDVGKGLQVPDDIGSDSSSGGTELEREASGAPVVRLASNIIINSLRKDASDIHIEPLDTALRVRYRVDGVLGDEEFLPKSSHLSLVSRFKIISGLDITERRFPQDGRFTARRDNRPVDFRVSTVPGKHGEKVAIRVLSKDRGLLSLDNVVIDPDALALLRSMIKRPWGIIYVTGPTGSGKTTTLYSMLSELNAPGVNISTVEDPVEYDLPGVTQVQVNHDIGLDFARILRAFLRQDPDILLIGETRDRETARIAVEAALTGHLVFTTLHTNDAASSFVRLIEMGIEPFLISTSVIGVVAQRLVRKLCPQCREPFTADEGTLHYLGLPPGTGTYRAKGCYACNQSGYRGRIGAFEVLAANEGIQGAINRSANTQEIREEALQRGMKPLVAYCRTLLREGLTSIDEVLRVIAVET
jgi:type IV pilus assembly protein PilB